VGVGLRALDGVRLEVALCPQRACLLAVPVPFLPLRRPVGPGGAGDVARGPVGEAALSVVAGVAKHPVAQVVDRIAAGAASFASAVVAWQGGIGIGPGVART